MNAIGVLTDEVAGQCPGHLVLGYIKVGDIFGEQSAIEDLPNDWTIEVSSKDAEVYKIHRSNFAQYFGGLDGVPANYLRSQRLLKSNWIKMKFQLLSKMNSNQILALEFRDDALFKKFSK